MSIRWMTRVWDDERLDGPRLLMMLALADHANEEGHAWPTAESLGKKTRQSRTRVYATLAQLRDEGYIRPDGKTFWLAIPENGNPENGTPQSRKRENPQTPLKEEPSEENRQLPQAAKPRARNPIWDALCQAVYGTQSPALTASETSDFAKTVKDLTAINATPEEILAFPKWWTATFPGAALTHRCFRLHFSRYRATVTKTTTRQLWQGDSRER